MGKGQECKLDLFDAVQNRDIQGIRELIERGISLDGGPHSDATLALYEATQSGDAEICRILLDAGVDPHQKNHRGDTPMHAAAFYGRVELYRILRERGADVNVNTMDGITPLHMAANMGHPEFCQELLRDGADIHAKDMYGTQPLLQAAMSSSRSADHMAVCKLLVERGADVNDREKHDDTALHIAAYNGEVRLCRLLVGHGADLAAEAQHGRCGSVTPLQLAVLESQIHVVRYFVRECGADLAQRNADGKTLTDLAGKQDRVMRELLASLKQELAAIDAMVAEGGADVANISSQPSLR